MCLHRPKELYGLLLKCSAQALHDITRTKLKNQHLQLHLTSVLHTWGRQAQHHPHVHIILPAITLDPKNKTLHRPQNPEDFLVHYRPLAARFRSLIQSTLKTEHPEIFAKLTAEQHRALNPRTQWNVQLQPVGSGKTALRYLAGYVQRSAFSAKRILGYDAQGNILLKWTYSTTKKTSVLKLHPHEFIRRWCLHILPKSFMRVRHYGLAAGAAKKNRHILRRLLGQAPEIRLELPAPEPFTCPHCQSELTFLREPERSGVRQERTRRARRVRRSRIKSPDPADHPDDLPPSSTNIVHRPPQCSKNLCPKTESKASSPANSDVIRTSHPRKSAPPPAGTWRTATRFATRPPPSKSKACSASKSPVTN